MTNRRKLIIQAVSGTALFCTARSAVFARLEHPDPQWHEAALGMLQLAESWGDQSYGAVVVMDGKIVGKGPSRVVKDKNPDAHAERVAILDAQQRLGLENLIGGVLYSTSRPCAVCAAAASCARVSKMYFGKAMQNADSPHHACMQR